LAQIGEILTFLIKSFEKEEKIIRLN